MHAEQNANNKMHFLNHLTHKTINAFCFIKHSALSVICYLNQVKHYRISAMFCLSYAKANTTDTMCFTMHVKQKCLLNHVAHKTFNAFCFYQSQQ